MEPGCLLPHSQEPVNNELGGIRKGSLPSRPISVSYLEVLRKETKIFSNHNPIIWVGSNQASRV
jgi:hypothetical protein